jgi:ketosteroid isomerase-like protein
MMTFAKKLFCTILVLLTCCYSSVYAQNKNKTKKDEKNTEPPKIVTLVDSIPKLVARPLTPEEQTDQDILRQQFHEFVNTYSRLEVTKDKQAVLKYLSKDVQAILVYFYVSGKVNMITGDYNSFSAYMDKVIATQGLDIKYDVSQVPRIMVNGDRAVIVYVVDYDIKKNGAIWSKGNETVTLTYRKMPAEGWKIIQYSIVNIEDEKLRGACLCDLFGDGTADYISKITIPNGRTYDNEMVTFAFTKIGDDRIVKTNKYIYRWAKNGEVFWREVGGATGVDSNERKIGQADTFEKQSVIALILKKHIFAEMCADIKIGVKK